MFYYFKEEYLVQKISIDVIQQKCFDLNVEFVERVTNGKNTCVRYICPRHREDGVQQSTWTSFKKKRHGCKYCAGRGMTTDRFIRLISELNPDIEVVGVYETEKSRMSCTCKICGYHWNPTAHDLKRAPRCGACSFRQMWMRERVPVDELQQRINQIQPNIVLSGEYHGVHKNMECKCTICGTVFLAHPSNLYTGNTGCPTCRAKEKIQKLRHNHEDVIKLIADVRPDVTVLGQYTRMHDKLHCYCHEHDCEY